MSQTPSPPDTSQDPNPEATDTTMQDSDTTTTLDPNSSSTATAPLQNSDQTQADAETEEHATVRRAEARIAQKKELTLREFLGKMDDYAPIIPDALTAHYLTLAGLPPPPATPLPLARLLALATQKFIADIAADSYQYARIRSSHTTSNTANALAAASGAPAGGAAAGTAAGGAKQSNIGTQRPGFGGGGGAQGAGQGAGQGQGRTVLTMEDLGMAVGEYGVNIKRGEFYR